VNLIITDWEEEWKNLVEKKRPLEDEEEKDKSEEEHDQMNGTKNLPGKSMVHKEGLKRKDKGTKQAGGAQKKFKVHR
jgi:hypothetical protein